MEDIYREMEKIFKEMKAICPRCKSWEYCIYRYLNNKGHSKTLQPRYNYTRCEKYFTLGGKLYDASLRSPSNGRIFCPRRVSVASPPFLSSGNQYGNGLYVQASSNSCCM
jgi:hypothetical protein